MGAKLSLAVVLGAGIFMALSSILLIDGIMPPAVDFVEVSLREALWYNRWLDVLGQLGLLLTSTYGVLVLIKERQ